MDVKPNKLQSHKRGKTSKYCVEIFAGRKPIESIDRKQLISLDKWKHNIDAVALKLPSKCPRPQFFYPLFKERNTHIPSKHKQCN